MHEAEDILERISSLVVKVCELKDLQLNKESRLDTLPSWDSFRLMSLILEMEQEFRIVMPVERYEELLDISSLLEVVKVRLKES